MSGLADFFERIVISVGRVCAWLTLLMVLVTVLVVVMRYFFDAGFIWMQELVTWAHAAVFLLGAGYTLARDEHVRVDVFYRRLSPAGRSIINIVGTLILLFPICGFMLYGASRYAARSWGYAERSAETGGLGYPFVPLGKTLIVVMLVLLIMQGVVIVVRNVHALRTGSYPGQSRDGNNL